VSEEPGRSTDQASDAPRWPASAGMLGLLLAFVGTVVFGIVVALVFLVFGVEDPEQTSAFEFTAIAAQSVAFVAAALIATARFAPTVRQFGFRSIRPSALGWALLALIAYFVMAGIYTVLANPPEDDLPRELGADKGTALAVLTGVFVIGLAPPIEELFFRGFLFQALRTRFGVWGGAALSGLLFGAIHLKPEFLVPLSLLGMILALLFQKTNSLWPCIMVHALNNALAFSVSL
jgi:membrane protease YdiL (CAAX protease family)